MPLNGSRDVALAIVRDVFGREARSAQAAFDYRVRRAHLGPRDRAFTAELAYGSIKMRRALDWYLQPYLGARTQTLPAPIAEALRLGVYQLRFMNGVDEHAAVFETVGAALRVGHRGTAGLVNAVLRKIIADAVAPPAEVDFPTRDEFLGTKFSVPTWIAAQWRERFGERAVEALAGIDGPPQLAIRVNTLRAAIDDVAATLERAGVATRRSDLVAESLIAIARPESALEDDADGAWSLQGESSCIPVDLLDPQPAETVVDLCSGRGNKAVQIAARMADRGALRCVELDERRVHVLGERLARAGVSIATVTRADARVAVPESDADGVLVDAPCTGLGILGRHPEARWRKQPDDALRLATDQAALLGAGAARVRPGGRLVYAVCSTDVRESEAVIDAFLQGGDFERAAVPARYDAFMSNAGDVIVPPGIEGRDGFYVASLRKRSAV